eukprot:TRINITY_DN13087_c0_g1_i1.p1 TRINITY_DN13087_c0_g1~~TRINITY_DN13087_c0_g1_i1.p1  ORF type:complete len:171 (-),score=26.88 TRINITY_DN13087_c0_g1_i1:98-535(-)
MRSLVFLAFSTCALAEFKGIHFEGVVDVDKVTELVVEKAKPGVVFVTQPWCGACKSLKKAISHSKEVKKLAKEFVMIHAEGDDGAQWQGAGESLGYIPRVYFLSSKGERLDQFTGQNEKYTRFFSDADSVIEAMTAVIANEASEL